MQPPDAPDRFFVIARRIFDGETMRGPGSVEIADGRIAGLHGVDQPPEGSPTVRLPDDAVLTPGFVDLQVNGGGGALLNHAPTAATVARIAAAHRRCGTTALLPTLITDGPEVLRALSACAGEAMALPGIIGFHLEGPFINPARKGIHPASAIRPLGPDEVDLLLRFAAFGRSLVTLAPECVPQGAIQALCAGGLCVAIGHSDATFAEAEDAVRAGASSVTHLFNAMSQMTGRAPGVVGAALSNPGLHAGIIADGLHVAPANVRAAWRAMGPERLFLVSDAMATAASDADGFMLHGRWIALKDGLLTDAQGTLGGASITLAEAVRKAVDLAGLPLADALRMATSTPADYLGLGDVIGRIRPGRRADLVAFGAAGATATWFGGVLQS
jgi:N-acetylglucosamine-6-phosphate deacetylase